MSHAISFEAVRQVHTRVNARGRIEVTVWKCGDGLNSVYTTTEYVTWSDALRDLAGRAK